MFAKRKVLFGAKTAAETMRDTGRRFMEAARYDDALEFFQRCKADDLTRQVALTALEEGNTALFMRAKKILGEPVKEDEWLALAANAEQRGLYSAAWVALRKAGRDEEAARVKQMLPGAAPAEQTQQGQEGVAEPTDET